MNFIAFLLLLCQAIPVTTRDDRAAKLPQIRMIERGPSGCTIKWSFCGEADVFRVTRSDPSGILQQRFLCPHVLNPQTFVVSTKVHAYTWTDNWPTDSTTVYTYTVTAFTAAEFDLDSNPMEIRP